ncbi:hypothetical protein SEA_EMIANNA_67 [Gordonia phage Emianna]|uniref:Uncharacterized protein n=1 Tax=Gordonia phage Emianna TaxID=2315530 RepID=A0A386KDM9_9CAUD|nr:hypothetical protein KNU15_gp67 [Gordonia phage Emianna]AYD83452.1 hypothetical protein SEA_EMIANNA_67 [Gordonia phage Emianna]AYD84339.1 hypothetical protein SEA_KURT_67 [Gordonia phage Kurt]QOP66728.1 hypothetical protein SEA_NOVUMREGINA_67 [Gordonia phage NovumRegina]QOR55909.1 hypothetical protein SEA_GROOTJR_69 [Gordonia phage GrootJr]
MATHRGVDPAILAYVRGEYGDVDEKLSTLMYEQGTEGPIRRFVGYLVEADDRVRDFITFLPIRDPDAREADARLNSVGSTHVQILRINAERVISIMEEVLLP